VLYSHSHTHTQPTNQPTHPLACWKALWEQELLFSACNQPMPIHGHGWWLMTPLPTIHPSMEPPQSTVSCTHKFGHCARAHASPQPPACVRSVPISASPPRPWPLQCTAPHHGRACNAGAGLGTAHGGEKKGQARPSLHSHVSEEPSVHQCVRKKAEPAQAGGRHGTDRLRLCFALHCTQRYASCLGLV
jgi:hypothetical protein